MTGILTGRSLAQRLAAPEELPLPSRHLGLTWSQLDSADLPELRQMLDESIDPEIFDETRLVMTLTWWLDDITKHSHVDAIIGRDFAGVVQAVGLVSVHPHPLTEAQADVFGAIRPQWRGRGIGRALLEWQDGRARQMMLQAGHDLPASIRSRVSLANMERRRLLAAGGFSPQSRWTYMVLPLSSSHCRQSAQARQRLQERGLHIVTFDEVHRTEVLRLHNRVSMVMDRRQPLSEKDWCERISAMDHDLSLLLIDDSQLVGYSLCSRESDGELRVGFYGIDRGYRHQGNGTDLILALIEPAIDAGLMQINVPVVSETTPSTQFLTTYGFIEGSSQILYSIDI
ncbi:GNAT family N-acetyltransferase [Trueperella sp. LYQ143]|uniref:GNAT family N-acetyltransferase n=1 Tax=unclassified Trueperella TaxID=2630174 RepID=UPI003983221A